MKEELKEGEMPDCSPKNTAIQDIDPSYGDANGDANGDAIGDANGDANVKEE